MTIIALAFIYPNKLNEFLEHELSDKLIQSYRDDLDFQNIIGNITIIGAQPTDGSKIPGIRKWSPAYVPTIFDKNKVDQVFEVSTEEAKAMTQRLAKEEGVFAGMSSGGAVATALKLIKNLDQGTVVVIICDRGDRYLSSDLFD